jgi:uncharacterized glyoxalase superfamily protein PhnB
MKFGPPTPALRIFDETVAREFYIDYLGFEVDWEHRFAPDMPIYMQVRRGECRIQLSGHYGDCCPGASLRIEVGNIDEYQADLLAKAHKHSRPGIESQPWGSRDMVVLDPFGNRLTFWQSTNA